MTGIARVAAPTPDIRGVALERPWAWLAAGWRDIWRRPGLSLGYGAAVCVAGGLSLFTAIGIATFYVGLVVFFPLIGHATWHACRELVEEG